MAHVIAALFKDSQKAGEAIAKLKNKGYTENISVIAKDEENAELKSHQIKQDVSDGAAGGAVAGAVIGGLAGLIASVGTVVLPGIGALLVAGPLAALWGIGGATTGALAGGLVGALVDAGIPEEKAKVYEESIRKGDVLVAVTVNHDSEEEVRSILEEYHAVETDTRHNFTAM